MRRRFSRQQRLTIVYLGEDETVIWPAAFVSLVGFALNAELLWYLYRMERKR
jgi:uncharacterized protein DUF6755